MRKENIKTTGIWKLIFLRFNLIFIDIKFQRVMGPKSTIVNR